MQNVEYEAAEDVTPIDAAPPRGTGDLSVTGSLRLRKIVENEDAPAGVKARAIYAISLMPDAIEDLLWLMGYVGSYLQLPIIECLLAFEAPLPQDVIQALIDAYEDGTVEIEMQDMVHDIVRKQLLIDPGNKFLTHFLDFHNLLEK